MIQQYPHTITIELKGSSYKDEDGNMQVSPSSFIEGSCRAELNTKARQIASASGTLISYAYVVYLPKRAEAPVPFGSKVIIVMAGNEVKGTVKGFAQNYFNWTLWL